MTDLLTRAAHRILSDWHSGSRDDYHMMRARLQAASIIEVLRELGYLNELGVAAARAECGELSPASLARLQGLVPDDD